MKYKIGDRVYWLKTKMKLTICESLNGAGDE